MPDRIVQTSLCTTSMCFYALATTFIIWATAFIYLQFPDFSSHKYKNMTLQPHHQPKLNYWSQVIIMSWIFCIIITHTNTFPVTCKFIRTHSGFKPSNPQSVLQIKERKCLKIKNVSVHMWDILLAIWPNRREASVCIVAK